ncbi:MAG: glycerol-3-phosphate dehydrogenase [Rhodobacteraceae bacterium]|nr:MAG: glycerol-3-phosphate dehydrogenase [Paracoccaceae bacterium]
MTEVKPYDIVIIGGGVNGCGIARDASGRGLRVALAEMNDLASATSSASTKLFHGGLRYLEYYKFRLVHEALVEREVLLRAMPHISWPMRFVLPLHKQMRPAWLIRLGLFMYDHMGGRKILPGTRSINLKKDVAGIPLKDKFTKAFEYSDCWVQDSRLVVLNARDAAQRGADIFTRTKVTAAEREGDLWKITLGDENGSREIYAKALVNAGGPWVADIVKNAVKLEARAGVRLVRGSHIVTEKLFAHDRAYFFQGSDNRIIFAIPYEDDFTLIGTTDQEHGDDPSNPVCTEAEADYLREFASEYFERPIQKSDIVWSYSGVRPLYDDGASSATEATRDYVLILRDDGPPLLNVFGGKITTYRRLSEAALAKLAPYFPDARGEWTKHAHLPGGDFPVDGVQDQIEALVKSFPFLDHFWARRLVRTYGTDAANLLEGAKRKEDLGEDFGASLTEAEVDWLMDHEFAQTAEDILWRRTKLGLRLSAEEADWLEQCLTRRAHK